MKRGSVTCWLVCVWGLVTSMGLAQAQEVARYFPNNMNSILAIDAAQLRSSALVQNPAGAETLQQLRADLPMVMPMGAERILFGSRMDVARLKPNEEMAILVGSQPWNVETIAQSIGGTLDSIGGTSCCLVGNQVLVAFEPNVLGVIWPADRQTAARWIADVQAQRTGQVSDLIRRAIQPGGGGPSLRWSLDLHEAFSPVACRRAASRSQVVDRRKLDSKAVGDLAAKTKGLSFDIAVTDHLEGSLRFELSGDPSVLKGQEKELILEVLGASGCQLSEMESWTVRVEGSAVVLSGALEGSSLRKLFQLLGLQSPQSPIQTVAGPDTSTPSPDPSMSAEKRNALDRENKTRRYVKEINKLSDDVKSIRNADLARQVRWVQSYAQRIENLPSRNVEPEIARLGKSIADRMFDIVGAYNDGNRRALDRQSSFVPDVQLQVNAENYDRFTTAYGRYYRYDPTYSMNVDVKSTVEEYRSIADQELATANQRAGEQIQAIRDELAQINSLYNSLYGGQK